MPVDDRQNVRRAGENLIGVRLSPGVLSHSLQPGRLVAAVGVDPDIVVLLEEFEKLVEEPGLIRRGHPPRTSAGSRPGRPQRSPRRGRRTAHQALLRGRDKRGWATQVAVETRTRTSSGPESPGPAALGCGSGLHP